MLSDAPDRRAVDLPPLLLLAPVLRNFFVADGAGRSAG